MNGRRDRPCFLPPVSACIAQLVEQLTLNRRHLVDSNGHQRTDEQLTEIRLEPLHTYIRMCQRLPKIALRCLLIMQPFRSSDSTRQGQFEFCRPSITSTSKGFRNSNSIVLPLRTRFDVSRPTSSRRCS